MRPIVSNVNAPSEKLAKWLVKELSALPLIEGLYVRNSFELIEKLKDIRLEEDEILVSFDVESLFPSIPIPEALIELENHLLKNDVPAEKREVYMHAAKTCMEQNYFQFRGEWFLIEA